MKCKVLLLAGRDIRAPRAEVYSTPLQTPPSLFGWTHHTNFQRNPVSFRLSLPMNLKHRQMFTLWRVISRLTTLKRLSRSVRDHEVGGTDNSQPGRAHWDLGAHRYSTRLPCIRGRSTQASGSYRKNRRLFSFASLSPLATPCKPGRICPELPLARQIIFE